MTISISGKKRHADNLLLKRNNLSDRLFCKDEKGYRYIDKRRKLENGTINPNRDKTYWILIYHLNICISLLFLINNLIRHFYLFHQFFYVFFLHFLYESDHDILNIELSIYFLNAIPINKSVQERIADMKPEAFYAGGNWGLFKEGYEDARDIMS